MIDPQRETQADILSLNAGLKSRRQIVAANGRDLETLCEEIAEDVQPVAA